MMTGALQCALCRLQTGAADSACGEGTIRTCNGRGVPRRDSVPATEFGCNETAPNVHHSANFMRQTMALMDSDTRVLRWEPAHSAWAEAAGPAAASRSCLLR